MMTQAMKTAVWTSALGAGLCLLGCSSPSDDDSTGTRRQAVSRPDIVVGSTEIRRLPLAIGEIKHDVAALHAIPPLAGAIRTVPPPTIRFFSTSPGQPDSVVQTAPGPLLSVTPGLNFDGAVATSTPPDPNGAVGATQFLQWVNIVFEVFDKTTGALLFGPAANNSFWSGFGGPCEVTQSGDAIAQYDKAAGRWVAEQPVFGSSSGLLCLAVSTTSDALGSYNRYAFAIPGNPDFPKLGVWSDAYYVSINTPSQSVCALDRASMLIGAPASIQCFQIPGGLYNFLPADIDGTTPPPAGAPGLFLEPGHDSASLRLWKLHADFGTPANSTLTGPVTLPVAAYTQNNCDCVPQAGVPQLLELNPGLHYRLAYRNFGSHESLVVSQSVVTGSSVGMRWYEIRNPSTSPMIFQQGTFAPDANYRWMGSIAMDHVGNMAMGYSLSSSSMHPSIAYTGRVPTDPPGTMESETTILAGPGSFPSNRWGDYSSMSVDPIDDCTFWYTNEYITATGTQNTRIASFRFPSCTASADFAFSASPSPVTVAAGFQATYTVRAAAAGGFASTVNLSVGGLPAGATFAFSPASIAGGSGSSTLTVSTAGTTPAGTYPLTITGSSGSLTHPAVVGLTVGLAPPPACVTAGTPGAWQNSPFVSQSGTFAAEFNATPLNKPITSFVGLSNGAQTTQAAFAALVRFGPSGDIDALNGTAFQAATTVPYAVASAYHFRLVLNVAAHTYSIFVTPPGGTEQTLGNNFAFAPSQNTVPSLNSWAAEMDSTTGGNLDVCEFAVSAGDFSIAATPSARTAPPGEGTTWSVTATPLSGFEGAVTFSVSGLPTTAVAAFNPPSVGASGTSEMSLLTDPSTPPAVYALQIIGSDGVHSHAVPVTLTVGNPTPDFALSASPSSVTVAPGSPASYTATVAPSNGFAATVNLTVTGLPAGASAQFMPTSIPSGSGNSTLAVSTTATTPTGSYAVTITGTSGSLTHSTSVTLVVATSGTFINSGGPAAAPFVADEFFSGGGTINHANPIDVSGVTNPAPAAVYQTARVDTFSYTVPGFVSGSSHTVRLHFCETYFSAAGARTFNVTINSSQVLTDFDIYKAAGAKNKAVIETFTLNASSSGQYVIQFTSVVNNSLVSGIEID